MDFVALGILLGLLVFSLVMFLVIRSQSRRSEHPEAQNSNYKEPTPLYHAPEGSQVEFSKSMLSLSLGKNSGDGSSVGGTESTLSLGRNANEGEKGRQGSKLFFEDTGPKAGNAKKNGVFGRTVEVV